MIYSLLRSASRIALRWYYSDVTVAGADRVPPTGPLLVAVNHPNALVDVLVAGHAVPRRLMFTAKATLFANPVAGTFLHWLGVLPLRRASDEASQGKEVDPSRNERSFDAVAAALAESMAILIFPEGKSHDDPAMAPSRTGAARMILHARATKGVKGVRILPIGLIFEKKERPRSGIVALVGEPMDVDALADGREPVARITEQVDLALRNLTLNYASIDDAERDARVAKTLQAIIRFEAPPIASAGDFRERAEIARLLPRLRATLSSDGHDTGSRARRFEADLLDFAQHLRKMRISLDDFSISRELGPGSVFLFRELLVLVLAGPVALWGWMNHVIPFRAALLAGSRVKHSNADPAMRAIVAGAAFVLMMYMLQGAVITLVFGPWWGLAYIISLPIAADINLRMRDRLHRALRRARAYLRFRSEPSIQDSITLRARALRTEAVALANVSGYSEIR